MQPTVNNAENILVIPLRYIGDTILTVPLIRNLRRLFPHAKLDVLVSRTTAPLLEACPYINDVIIEPKSSIARYKLLKSKGYDAVFSIRKSVSMAALCQLAGIPVRVGYDKQRFPFGYKRWGWFLSHTARYPGLKTETPQAISHLGLLTASGLPLHYDYLELWATEADETNLDAILSRHGIDSQKPIAIVHAASASHGKQIEMIKFADSIQRLQQAGYQVVATGTQGDRMLYDMLQQKSGLAITNLAGETTLRETFALYKRTQVLLTVDSSPIHMGAAANIPNIVGVFGPTNERQWGPHNTNGQFQPVFIDLPCRPCYAKICSHNRCRTELTGEQIATAVQQSIQHPPH